MRTTTYPYRDDSRYIPGMNTGLLHDGGGEDKKLSPVPDTPATDTPATGGPLYMLVQATWWDKYGWYVAIVCGAAAVIGIILLVRKRRSR